MFDYEQKCLMYLSDAYTLMYGFIGKKLVDKLGIRGEDALREASRQFGYDRAETSRKKHLEVNAKINMLNLFTLFHDLPGDPRFRRELQEINPQERVSHTLICPMADIWEKYGQREIGRIYCEEFHPACYQHYAFDMSQVNLSKTLTQEGDEYCDFNVILRPERIPDELKPVCFAEYDPFYVQPEIEDPPVDGKTGFATLSVKLVYYMLRQAAKDLGDEGIQACREGLGEWAQAMAEFYQQTAEESQVPLDSKYIKDNLPFDLATAAEDGAFWQNYDDEYHVKDEVQKYFCDPLAAKLGLKP